MLELYCPPVICEFGRTKILVGLCLAATRGAYADSEAELSYGTPDLIQNMTSGRSLSHILVYINYRGNR